MNQIGQPVLREEDLRLLQGRGRYLDDVSAPDLTHAAVLRSPVAHADILSLGVEAARAAPGVLAVLTGDDLAERGLGNIGVMTPCKKIDGSDGFVRIRPLLAQGRVRYVGEAVAFVVAETLNQAKDAAELIEFEFDTLPALATLDDALAPGAPALWDENPDNQAYTFKRGDAEATEAAIAGAAHVVRHRVCVNRIAGNAMENRGCIGRYDEFEDRYHLRATVQSVHGMRQQIADQIFKMPQSKLHVVCDNMGGGFGIRGGVYPEYALSLWASEVVGRPVKWIADRAESILSDDHARGGFVEAELALDEDGKFLGLRTHTKVPIGAYYTTDRNVGCATSGLGGLAGVYGIPNVHAQVTGVLTNMMSNAQYRGGAKPEPVHVLEVMVDIAARQLGMDPVELRRRNTLPPEALPFKTSMGDHFDCGDFSGNYEDCLTAAGYGDLEERRAEAIARGKLLGFGTSNSITGVANTNFEHVEIRFDASGGVTLLSGAMDHGQGHGTTFKQVLSDRLGIDPAKVTYRYGDTDKVAHGVGTFNARVAVFVSAAIVEAADKIIGKGKQIAAHMLETADSDIEFTDGISPWRAPTGPSASTTSPRPLSCGRNCRRGWSRASTNTVNSALRPAPNPPFPTAFMSLRLKSTSTPARSNWSATLPSMTPGRSSIRCCSTAKSMAVLCRAPARSDGRRDLRPRLGQLLMHPLWITACRAPTISAFSTSPPKKSPLPVTLWASRGRRIWHGRRHARGNECRERCAELRRRADGGNARDGGEGVAGFGEIAA